MEHCHQRLPSAMALLTDIAGNNMAVGYTADGREQLEDTQTSHH